MSSPPDFSWVRVAQSLGGVFWGEGGIVDMLTMYALSVGFLFASSDYPFGILKLFLSL